MTLRKRENTENLKRKCCITVSGELAFGRDYLTTIIMMMTTTLLYLRRYSEHEVSHTRNNIYVKGAADL
jgi:hypothetical protein